MTELSDKIDTIDNILHMLNITTVTREVIDNLVMILPDNNVIAECIYHHTQTSQECIDDVLERLRKTDNKQLYKDISEIFNF